MHLIILWHVVVCGQLICALASVRTQLQQHLLYKWKVRSLWGNKSGSICFISVALCTWAVTNSTSKQVLLRLKKMIPHHLAFQDQTGGWLQIQMISCMKVLDFSLSFDHDQKGKTKLCANNMTCWFNPQRIILIKLFSMVKQFKSNNHSSCHHLIWWKHFISSLPETTTKFATAKLAQFF